MDITSLLVKLSQYGIRLSVENNQLVVPQTINKLPPEIIKELNVHKKGLISKLSEVNTAKNIAHLHIETISKSAELYMSIGQERLWYVHKLLGPNCLYNQQSELRILGKLNISILTNSLEEVVCRHEILRTTLSQNSMGVPLQIINDIRKIEIPIIKMNCDSCSQYEIKKLIDRFALEEGQKIFNISKDYLFRICLLRLSHQEHILLITMHHAITDGWSFDVFLRELWSNYMRIQAKKALSKNKPIIQYHDFSYWQKSLLGSDIFEKQLKFWKTQLTGLTPILNLPYDYKRPISKKYKGKMETFVFSKRFTNRLSELSLSRGVILPMTLLAAFKIILMRYSGQTDIVIGMPVAYRHHPQLTDLIGFFVNTVVLRSDLSRDKTFESLLNDLKKTSIDAYANQDVPFDKVVKMLQPERTKNSAPLFQIMFVFQSTLVKELELPGLRISQLNERRVGMAKFDLNLSIKETSRGLEGFLEYSTELFKKLFIQNMLMHYKNILEAVVDNPKLTLARIPLITETERKQLIARCNRSGPSCQFTKGIHQLIEEQVRKTPNAVALVYGQQQMTYQETNHKANQLAYYLQSIKVGLGVKIGLYLEKSIDLIIGLLAILKTGAAYVPLDTEYPEDRLQFMIKDSEISMIISHSKSLKNTMLKFKNIVYLYLDLTITEKQPVNDLENIDFSGRSIAYIMYTSGSTGVPKGVRVTHKGLCNLASSYKKDEFPISSKSRVLQFASISFDVAISDIIMALTNGASLFLGNKEESRPGKNLATFIQVNRITHIHLTPSTLAMLPTDKYVDLKCIIVGGEAFSITLLDQWSRGRHFFNSYGATETSVTVALAKFKAGCERVLIGKAINNTKIYILDANNQPVPDGVIGELCVVGASVAEGYWNRPRLTSEKFMGNPFRLRHDNEDSIMYKTGDLARYLPCGNLEFFGRLDQQVKIRGYRIELAEIEVVLNRHPDVISSLVVIHEKAPDNKLLVAYVASEMNELELSEQLYRILKDKLPNYMIPAIIMILNEFPKTQNGKINHMALPVPEPKKINQIKSWSDNARTNTELKLVQMWQDLLGCESIGIKDNFFRMGGDSLLGIRLLAKIKCYFGKDISFLVLLENPTIADLAIKIGENTVFLEHETWSPLVAMQVKGTYPPLFCVHPAGGTVFCYLDLATQLEMKQQPLYGLQAQGLEENQILLETNEQMAASYLQAIRKVQLQGPYFLLGWSAGGMIAYELAQQFYRMGEKVAFLGILDTYADFTKNSRANCLELNDDMALLARLYIKENPYGQLPDNLVETLKKLKPMAQLSYIVKQAKILGKLPLDISDKQAERLVKAFKNDCVANRRYFPKPYPGKITVFRPIEPLTMEVDKSNDLDWRLLSKQEVKVYETPGNHFNMIFYPNIKILASQIFECLKQCNIEGKKEKVKLNIFD